MIFRELVRHLIMGFQIYLWFCSLVEPDHFICKLSKFSDCTSTINTYSELPFEVSGVVLNLVDFAWYALRGKEVKRKFVA